MARRKPTIREVAAKANEAMQRTEILRSRMMEMEIVLSNYISYNKDEKKLGKFIEKRAKENAEAREKEDAETRAGKDLDNK